MNSTLAAPGAARSGLGQAGSDSSKVLPMTPGNLVPGVYSFNVTCASPPRAQACTHRAARAVLAVQPRSRIRDAFEQRTRSARSRPVDLYCARHGQQDAPD